jgi:hyperosmotically inducible periplasmic protein
MSLFNNVLVVGLVGVVFVAGGARPASASPQAATSAATQPDDSTLKTRVTASLKKNATLAAREVDVDVHEGIVTLKGTVRTADEKAHAARLATLKGVTAVRNEIVVDAAAAKSGASRAIDATAHAGETGVDATKGAAQTTGEKAKAIAGATATKTKAVAATTGEAIDDTWITTKVKTKFFDETLLKSSDIHVETTDRVVTLTGAVASSSAKTRAATIASGTEGVTRVVNQLVVKGK